MLRLVDLAYEQQRTVDRLGDPRDPATKHRPDASYRKWFSSTAGEVLRYARRHTSAASCQRVRACLRVRLGATGVMVNRARHARIPFQQRGCQGCMERSGMHVVEDIMHACFECPAMKEQLAAKGWEQPPEGAASFAQLFPPKSSASKGVRFLADVSELVDGPTAC